MKGNKEGRYKQNVERVARDLAELYRLPGNHSHAGKFDKARDISTVLLKAWEKQTLGQSGRTNEKQ